MSWFSKQMKHVGHEFSHIGHEVSHALHHNPLSDASSKMLSEVSSGFGGGSNNILGMIENMTGGGSDVLSQGFPDLQLFDSMAGGNGGGLGGILNAVEGGVGGGDGLSGILGSVEGLIGGGDGLGSLLGSAGGLGGLVSEIAPLAEEALPLVALL